jgi:hypothetical protein
MVLSIIPQSSNPLRPCIALFDRGVHEAAGFVALPDSTGRYLRGSASILAVRVPARRRERRPDTVWQVGSVKHGLHDRGEHQDTVVLLKYKPNVAIGEAHGPQGLPRRKRVPLISRDGVETVLLHQAE